MAVSPVLPLVFLFPLLPVLFCVVFPGGPGSDLSLYSEAAPDHGADGVLSGGHQGERSQWFPTGTRTRCFKNQ